MDTTAVLVDTLGAILAIRDTLYLVDTVTVFQTIRDTLVLVQVDTLVIIDTVTVANLDSPERTAWLYLAGVVGIASATASIIVTALTIYLLRDKSARTEQDKWVRDRRYEVFSGFTAIVKSGELGADASARAMAYASEIKLLVDDEKVYQDALALARQIGASQKVLKQANGSSNKGQSVDDRGDNVIAQFRKILEAD